MDGFVQHAQSIQPVTNGTSPLEQLPDHFLTASMSGLREIRRGSQHPFFFAQVQVPGRTHPHGGLLRTGGVGKRLRKFAAGILFGDGVSGYGSRFSDAIGPSSVPFHHLDEQPYSPFLYP